MPSALTAAAELSARYINDRHLPDKAIDVIDEAGAAQKILPKAKQKRIIGKHEIEEIISKIARVPVQTVSVDDRNALKNLDRDLKAVVFGQDKAIDALAAAIKMARSGLGNPQKPIGNFLFSGPTGVGKTEVARQLAYIMGVELVRFDMSEYMERHAVSRLIGAPPGYIGFDQGGLLTEAITKQPYSVLLLDEIEKAHPDIFNILLQVMDHGTLTDNNGRKADFRHVVIVMTTNAGAAELSKSGMGFTPSPAGGRRDGRDQAHVHAGVQEPAGRHHLVQRARSRCHPARGGQVPDAARGAAGGEEGGADLHSGAAGIPGEEGFRSPDGRAPDGAADPGHDPLGARRRAAVRTPRPRRQGDRGHRPGREDPAGVRRGARPRRLSLAPAVRSVASRTQSAPEVSVPRYPSHEYHLRNAAAINAVAATEQSEFPRSRAAGFAPTAAVSQNRCSRGQRKSKRCDLYPKSHYRDPVDVGQCSVEIQAGGAKRHSG